MQIFSSVTFICFFLHVNLCYLSYFFYYLNPVTTHINGHFWRRMLKYTKCQVRYCKSQFIFNAFVISHVCNCSLCVILFKTEMAKNQEQVRSYTHVVPSKTIPDARPKWANCIPVFRPKRRKNPTRWGSTYLYSSHKGESPPPGYYYYYKNGK